MARRRGGLNRHQRAAHKTGEPRVGREEIDQLLEWSRSTDAKQRSLAAQYLCPCHVRRRIDAVWQALYRMLEDPDVTVRRAAWHTLEDGGCSQDPTLDEIIARALHAETDPVVLRYARQFARPREEKETMVLKLATRPEYAQHGKCDFCGKCDTYVKIDPHTTIDSDDGARPARICQSCGQNYA